MDDMSDDGFMPDTLCMRAEIIMKMALSMEMIKDVDGIDAVRKAMHIVLDSIKPVKVKEPAIKPVDSNLSVVENRFKDHWSSKGRQPADPFDPTNLR